ncbi:MAG: hypothetical protein PHG58_07870 [Clostridia bacterium]|nr:hypothetical protein [Clostridia bacterium]
MELAEATVEYLGYHIKEKIPRCPKCRQIYISEELVDGKVTMLETSLEEK